MHQKNELFDTHMHIHFSDYPLEREEVYQSAREAGVTRMLAVGCRLEDSQGAVDFAATHPGVWAVVGIHPHEAQEFLAEPDAHQRFETLLRASDSKKLVAIGEIGLDYHYQHSSKAKQKQLLEWQLGLAEKYDLPVIFHIREAFQDFWSIFDLFNVKKGLIHSFTGVESDVEDILRRNLYIALNGIVTFTKQNEQLAAAKAVPLEKLVLETDAPYLTPKPFRGKVCKPEHVELTAKFLAELRGEAFEHIAHQTTRNAQKLFNVN